MFSDGHCSIFAMPEALQLAGDNPVRSLRCRLWADLLNLPAGIAEVLLADPVASTQLFDRTSFDGNRFVPSDAFPVDAEGLLPLVGTARADSADVIVFLLKIVGGLLEASAREEIFNIVSDPSSFLQGRA
jgi:hypothetical protein